MPTRKKPPTKKNTGPAKPSRGRKRQGAWLGPEVYPPNWTKADIERYTRMMEEKGIHTIPRVMNNMARRPASNTPNTPNPGKYRSG